MIGRRYLSSSSFVLACLCSTMLSGSPAMAQTSQVADPAPGPIAATPSTAPVGEAQAAAPVAEQAGEVGEIIVTAQKRRERLQDVPISIAAISASQAAGRGINSTMTLQGAVPGLVINHTANEGNIFIRGVGTNLFGPSSEQTVALFVDGVYYPSPEANLFDFNNIDRVEVLKGPQGTLFGRNTTGGVVHVITRDPIDRFSGNASIGYGNYQSLAASGYVTGGLADGLAADLAFTYANQGKGWGKNFTTGRDNGITADHNYAIRSKWKWTVAPGTVIRLTGDYAHSKSRYAYQLLPGVIGVDGVSTYPGKYNSVSGLNDVERANTGGGALQIDQDIGRLHLVSITAYRHTDINYVLDQDDTPANAGNLLLPSKAHNWSQELQLHGPSSGRIKWVIGGYYFNARAAYTPANVADGLLILADSQKTESFAAFGQASAEVLRATNLTVGLRYTTEKQRLDVQRFTFLGSDIDIPSDKQRFSKLTWRLALDHHFSRDILGYISYNRGFKSGGYNLLAPTTAPFKPEVLDAYEIGIKTELFDRKLRFNLSAFQYEYKNIQVTIPQQGGTITVNAARARVRGVEADFQARLFGELTLTGGLAYLHGRYTSYPNALAIGRNGESTDSNGDPLTIDAKGNHTIATPTWTGNISADYLFKTGIGNFRPTISASYNSGYYFYADNRLKQPSYWLLNASLNWTMPGDHLEAALWAKNLTNSRYYGGRSEQAGLGDAQRQAAPRTYGVTLRANF